MEGVYDYEIIGARIKKLRLRSGMTQGELAEELGCSIPYLSYVENGRRVITFEMFLRVLQTFAVTPDELLMPDMPDPGNSRVTEITRLVNSCTGAEQDLILQYIGMIKRISGGDNA